jgi:hypothetical protein
MENNEKQEIIKSSLEVISKYETNTEYKDILNDLKSYDNSYDPVSHEMILRLVNHQRNERGKETKKTSN